MKQKKEKKRKGKGREGKRGKGCGRRERTERKTSNSNGRKGDEKFYERRPTVLLAGWFELHQLKKAVPQKFHNAAGGGLRQMSLHTRRFPFLPGQ